MNEDIKYLREELKRNAERDLAGMRALFPRVIEIAPDLLDGWMETIRMLEEGDEPVDNG
jgi:hypothetical protein